VLLGVITCSVALASASLGGAGRSRSTRGSRINANQDILEYATIQEY
jgi:hypothetical protein